ncbi:MAG: triose-phosphate isomerase family protein [Candidatus Roizmanbacteria bacterium]|nr:triose-phosphate isomerase family protein [Candidatus Roizmanbacteria bacterium]
MKYLIANWKAQMTKNDIVQWTYEFSALMRKDSEENRTLKSALEKNTLRIIICAPFPHIILTGKLLSDHHGIYMGAQTVSAKEPGKFTGEVTAVTLNEICGYVLIGHSERRSHFNESEEDIQNQIQQCIKARIIPILCVRTADDIIYPEAQIIAYEPVEAIGSGANASVADVLMMKKHISLPEYISFLYGGSADDLNMKEYLDTNEVDGFLVGTASLVPDKFYQMAVSMSK